MRLLLGLVVVACASPSKHVDLPQQLPSQEASNAPGLASGLDDLECNPQPMAAIDVTELDGTLAKSRDYAQRCCTGDETGDVTVRVTPAPSGYQTAIEIEPESIASSAAGACVHAVFHRLLVKPYEGAEKTASVIVRLRDR